MTKTIHTKGSTKASTEEDIEQHDQDRSLSQSPSLDARFEQYPDKDPEILLQLDVRPISRTELMVEGKAIYTGLEMVEAKCIEVDQKYLLAAQVPLKSDQLQSLVALHEQVHTLFAGYIAGPYISSVY